MSRLNALLLAVLVSCALALVTSQHYARKLYAELEIAQQAAKRIDEDWSKLQLEQSTWAMHARIEKIASTKLRMRTPSESRVHLVPDASPRVERR